MRVQPGRADAAGGAGAASGAGVCAAKPCGGAERLDRRTGAGLPHRQCAAGGLLGRPDAAGDTSNCPSASALAVFVCDPAPGTEQRAGDAAERLDRCCSVYSIGPDDQQGSLASARPQTAVAVPEFVVILRSVVRETHNTRRKQTHMHAAQSSDPECTPSSRPRTSPWPALRPPLLRRRCGCWQPRLWPPTRPADWQPGPPPCACAPFRLVHRDTRASVSIAEECMRPTHATHAPNCSMVMVGKMWLGRNTSPRIRSRSDVSVTRDRASITTMDGAVGLGSAAAPPATCCTALICGVTTGRDASSAASVASSGCMSTALYTALWMRSSHAARSSSSSSSANCEASSPPLLAAPRLRRLATRCSMASSLALICPTSKAT